MLVDQISLPVWDRCMFCGEVVKLAVYPFYNITDGCHYWRCFCAVCDRFWYADIDHYIVAVPVAPDVE